MAESMAYKIEMALLGMLVLVLIDAYAYQAIRVTSHRFHSLVKGSTRAIFWISAVLAWAAFLWVSIAGVPNEKLSQWVVIVLFIFYFSKAMLVVVIFIDDVRRGILWARRYMKRKKAPQSVDPNAPRISRSEFLARTAVVAGTVPFSTLSFGILSGAHNFRLRKQPIYLPHLPKAFDGITIGQISDIHTGSLFKKKAIRGGVDLLLDHKPDIIFFTGDLVNVETKEVKEYFDVFDKLRAPLGVFSVTGNHDYGNYRQWPNAEAKRKNLDDMLEAHRLMGYDLLMNEHRFIELQGEKLAIIGVENWGVGPPHRFPKYGKLAEAYKGTEEAAVKLLLSHDPTHWDAQIRPEFPEIDVTFAGHTHGYQLGVSVGSFTWSPAQYRFKQWAGLYQQGNQYLYVNRGFGCVGYPGRIGMPPELTLFELRRG